MVKVTEQNKCLKEYFRSRSESSDCSGMYCDTLFAEFYDTVLPSESFLNRKRALPDDREEHTVNKKIKFGSCVAKNAGKIVLVSNATNIPYTSDFAQTFKIGNSHSLKKLFINNSEQKVQKIVQSGHFVEHLTCIRDFADGKEASRIHLISNQSHSDCANLENSLCVNCFCARHMCFTKRVVFVLIYAFQYFTAIRNKLPPSIYSNNCQQHSPLKSCSNTSKLHTVESIVQNQLIKFGHNPFYLTLVNGTYFLPVVFHAYCIYRKLKMLFSSFSNMNALFCEKGVIKEYIANKWEHCDVSNIFESSLTQRLYLFPYMNCIKQFSLDVIMKKKQIMLLENDVGTSYTKFRKHTSVRFLNEVTKSVCIGNEANLNCKLVEHFLSREKFNTSYNSLTTSDVRLKSFKHRFMPYKYGKKCRHAKIQVHHDPESVLINSSFDIMRTEYLKYVNQYLPVSDLKSSVPCAIKSKYAASKDKIVKEDDVPDEKESIGYYSHSYLNMQFSNCTGDEFELSRNSSEYFEYNEIDMQNSVHDQKKLMIVQDTPLSIFSELDKKNESADIPILNNDGNDSEMIICHDDCDTLITMNNIKGKKDECIESVHCTDMSENSLSFLTNEQDVEYLIKKEKSFSPQEDNMMNSEETVTDSMAQYIYVQDSKLNECKFSESMILNNGKKDSEFLFCPDKSGYFAKYPLSIETTRNDDCTENTFLANNLSSEKTINSLMHYQDIEHAVKDKCKKSNKLQEYSGNTELIKMDLTIQQNSVPQTIKTLDDVILNNVKKDSEFQISLDNSKLLSTLKNANYPLSIQAKRNDYAKNAFFANNLNLESVINLMCDQNIEHSNNDKSKSKELQEDYSVNAEVVQTDLRIQPHCVPQTIETLEDFSEALHHTESTEQFVPDILESADINQEIENECFYKHHSGFFWDSLKTGQDEQVHASYINQSYKGKENVACFSESSNRLCYRPLRIGLSRKQRVKSLHPYFRKTLNSGVMNPESQSDVSNFDT